ncbi:MAG: 7-carboxy-7-deazaguanine synthase QueE [Puniceicoccales bacterium]|jgi:organic radical activating enzyme|nr:7-carboxy-7-deazaguanine synthase QueE [Puniceicoccales bacterium]
MSREYPVHESFYSWQGEGLHTGRAAFFIRLQGCPVRCSWCDSRETWVSNPPGGLRETAEALAARASKTRAEFAVVTGGEPAIHDLGPLTSALHGVGLRVHLETCGAFPLRGSFDWVALSPKCIAPARAENLALADELKLIIEAGDDLVAWADFLRAHSLKKDCFVWLHPEWSRRADEAFLSTLTDWVKEHGFPWRTGWQTHKLYRAE